LKEMIIVAAEAKTVVVAVAKELKEESQENNL
jgi:hypothetical protein